MHELLDVIPEAEDLFEARQIFEKALDGKRQRLEEQVDRSTGEVIEVDTYARLRDEVPEVVSRFEECLENVTAVFALPASMPGASGRQTRSSG